MRETMSALIEQSAGRAQGEDDERRALVVGTVDRRNA